MIGCYGPPVALATLALSQLQIRVAPDELLVVGAAADAASLAALASERLAALDPGALVFDVSDGYAAWTLRGPEWPELFARLCAIPPPEPPAQLQGLFAHVPAKLLAQDEELTVVVSASLSHHIRARVRAAAIGIELRELAGADSILTGTGERG